MIWVHFKFTNKVCLWDWGWKHVSNSVFEFCLRPSSWRRTTTPCTCLSSVWSASPRTALSANSLKTPTTAKTWSRRRENSASSASATSLRWDGKKSSSQTHFSSPCFEVTLTSSLLQFSFTFKASNHYWSYLMTLLKALIKVVFQTLSLQIWS